MPAVGVRGFPASWDRQPEPGPRRVVPTLNGWIRLWFSRALR
jgi:hypothetical protein